MGVKFSKNTNLVFDELKNAKNLHKLDETYEKKSKCDTLKENAKQSVQRTFEIPKDLLEFNKKTNNKTSTPPKIPLRKKSEILKIIQIHQAKSKLDFDEDEDVLSVDSHCTVEQFPTALSHLGYEIHQQIGFGGFSTVYIATNHHLPGVKMACKVFKFNELNREWMKKCLKNEMRIMLRMNHPNVIHSFDAIKTRSKAYIFMKLAVNGSMDSYLLKNGGKASETQSRKWFFGLLSGLEYMHSQNVVHRDLKLENFLLGENFDALISDFSFAVFANINTSKVLCSTLCGTPEYIAPEIHMLADKKTYDAKKSDMYSIGVCLFESLHGHLPFQGLFEMKCKRLVLRQLKCKYKMNTTLSENCQNLIKCLLEPKPEKRPKAKEALAHPWFKQIETNR